MKPFPCNCRPLKALVYTVIFLLFIIAMMSGAFMLVDKI